MKINIKCLNCGNEFTTDYKHRDKKFCNRNCYFEYARKNNLLGKKKDNSVRETRVCVECKKEFVERKKYKRKLCSEGCRIKWNNRGENKKIRINNSKKTTKERYGVNSIFKSEEFQKNLKYIYQKKYGVNGPMEIPEFVNKLQETIRKKQLNILLPKLKNNNLKLLDDYSTNKDKNSSLSYSFECLKCGNIFSSTVLGSGKIPICRKCYPIIKNSLIEVEVRDFINKHKIYHVDGDRKILDGKEIDIFLPDFNIGIEVNGNYYHSEKYGEKDRKYHINKSKNAHEKNIKLIHIFEDEITQKKEIVFSRILNMVGKSKRIYARNTIFKEINKETSREFLKNNHLQGDSVDSIRLGLYHNNILVTVMTFSKNRIALGNRIEDDNYEIIRFCNLLGYNIVGGFSKLITNFIKTYKPNKITTYADIRWSGLNHKDTVYYKNGFNFVGNTSPNYWYIDNNNSIINRFHRYTFRKNKLVKEGFDKNKTEWEIMQERDFDRVWDCGSMKFEMTF